MSNKSLFLYQSLVYCLSSMASEGRNPKKEKRAKSRVTGFLYPFRGGPKAGLGGP